MKCKICGKRFIPRKTDKYLVREQLVGLECIAKTAKTLEAFDCKRCGCQNIVNIREVIIVNQENNEGDDILDE